MCLLALPPELLHDHLLLRLDLPALRALALSCKTLHRAIASQKLWNALLQRRFRTHERRPLIFRAPFLRSARDIYIQWHRQRRPPTSSRHPGTLTSALFAKSFNPHDPVLVWTTVCSADDCRVGPQGMLLRIVVQNTRITPAFVLPELLFVTLTTGRTIHVQQQQLPHHHQGNHICCKLYQQHKQPLVIGTPAASPSPQLPPQATNASHIPRTSPHPAFVFQSPSTLPAHNTRSFAVTKNDRNARECNHATLLGNPADHDHNTAIRAFLSHLPLPSVFSFSPDLSTVLVDTDNYVIDRVQDFVAAGHPEQTELPCKPNDGPLPHQICLLQNDFLILHIRIKLTGVVHEVDAIERLKSIGMPICYHSSAIADHLVLDNVAYAEFDERALWDRYERMPGGWWVRREANSASRH